MRRSLEEIDRNTPTAAKQVSCDIVDNRIGQSVAFALAMWVAAEVGCTRSRSSGTGAYSTVGV